jgi:hypothetical protein
MNNEFKITESILEIKATGSVQDISADLQKPDGKPIEELLDDQEKENSEERTS